MDSALLSVWGLFILGVYGVSVLAQTKLPIESNCDLDCANGHCDVRTRTCVCLPGWAGAACDYCVPGLICASSAPVLSLILPQAGPVSNQSVWVTVSNGTTIPPPTTTPQFVYAIGNDLPKGRATGRYNCIFGTVSTIGRWLSTRAIQCPLPTRSLAGKHIFNLVPTGGSDAYIPYDDGGTKHFTFFDPCDIAKCQGFCLGPMCLCTHSRSGQQCEIAKLVATSAENATEMVGQLASNNSAITEATEFRPFVAELPVKFEWIQDPSSRLTLWSDTPGEELELDPFERTVHWANPKGRTRPYAVSVLEESEEGAEGAMRRTRLNWSLKVEPSYRPVLQNTSTKVNNALVLTGHLVQLNLHTPSTNQHNMAIPPQRSVPLSLHVYSGELALETIEVPSDHEGKTFGYRLFPYVTRQSTAVDHHFAITVTHPGVEYPEVVPDPAIRWTPPHLVVEGFRRELVDQDGTFTDSYSIHEHPSNGHFCSVEKEDAWMFEVVEPRKRVRISGINFTGSGSIAKVQLTFGQIEANGGDQEGQDQSSTQTPTFTLRTAVICDGRLSTVVRQSVRLSSNPSANRNRKTDATVSATLSPKRLFVDGDASPDQGPPVFSLDIALTPSDSAAAMPQPQLDRRALESASYTPFALIWLNAPAPGVWRLWLALQANHSAPPPVPPISEPISPVSAFFKPIIDAAQHQQQEPIRATEEGAIVIRGSRNLALSIPYTIIRRGDGGRRPLGVTEQQFFSFTLTLQSEPPVAATVAATVDVELFSTRRDQFLAKAVALNMPTVIGQVRADFFQLKLRSSHFLPHISLLKITAQNNSLMLTLVRRPLQFFTFDGTNFASDHLVPSIATEQSENASPTSPPTVRLNPAVFRDLRLPAEQFADVQYTDGPEDSFAFLADGTFRSTSTLPIQLAIELPNSTICLSCGVRLPLRFTSKSLPPKKSPSKTTDNNKNGANCEALILTVPFAVSMPRGQAAAHSFALVDLRPRRSRYNQIYNEDNDMSAEDKNGTQNPRVCYESFNGGAVPSLAEKTQLVRSCPVTKIRGCRRLYRPATAAACAGWWSGISDDLLSVHSLAQFLLLSANCRIAGVRFAQMRRIIESKTRRARQVN